MSLRQTIASGKQKSKHNNNDFHPAFHGQTLQLLFNYIERINAIITSKSQTGNRIYRQPLGGMRISSISAK